MPAAKLLLIKHGAFGDLIQADGVFRDIRQHFSNAEIVLLTMSRYESLMQRSPYVDRIIIDDRQPLIHLKQQFKLRQQLIQEQFDLVIDLQNSDRSALYQRLFLPKLKWISRRAKVSPESGLKGLVQLLSEEDIPVHHALSPNVVWMVENTSEILRKYPINKPYIALIPGSSAQHKEKRWPHYPDLSKALIRLGYNVVNILGPDELEMATDLAGYSPMSKGDLFNWFELASILNRASFVIGNDTGPSHIASCLGRPGLALFGPTTSVSRSEIERGRFQALQVNDLRQLRVEQVLKHLPRI